MAESETAEPAVIHADDGTQLTVTLLEAVDGVAPAPNWQSEVPSEARLVGARLRVENTGSIKYDQNIAWGALLIDTADQQYEAATIKTAVPSLSDVRLEPGDRRAGMIVFVLPKSEEPAAIQLSLDGGHGPDRALWRLVV